MENHIRTGLVEKLGKQVGETINLFVQEDDILEVGVLIAMYEYPGHSDMLIIQTNAIGFHNVKTDKMFRFQPDFKAQEVCALNGESGISFYKKNCKEDTFIRKQIDILVEVIKHFDSTYQSYIKQAKQ